MDKDKPWLSIDKQVDLLQSRGVVIEDHSVAKKFLLENNYFRISGFTLCHRTNDIFQKGTRFSEIIEICNFDCRMRALIMELLGHVEVTYRSLIAYYHTKRFGPMGYEDSAAFNDLEIYSNMISKVCRLKKHYEDNPEVFIKHYVEDKNGRLPFWAVMELMSFTDTSKIFRALTFELKKQIVFDYLGFSFGSAVMYVENWLWCASVLRNIAAHRGRLYNRLLQIKPRLSKYDKGLLLHTKEHSPVLNKLFAYLIAVRKLEPNKIIWNTFEYDVSELTLCYPMVDLRMYGFPPEWRSKIHFV